MPNKINNIRVDGGDSNHRIYLTSEALFAANYGEIGTPASDLLGSVHSDDADFVSKLLGIKDIDWVGASHTSLTIVKKSSAEWGRIHFKLVRLIREKLGWETTTFVHYL